uniref:Uncharacterized protein n=1 Tax=Oryza meridionalis TaxID=40149 RepID=A0A0E0E731_9ORYZ
MVAAPGIKERREVDGGTQLRTAAVKKASGEGARGMGGGHGGAARKRMGRPAAKTEQRRRPNSIISRVNEHAQRIYAVYRGEGERSSSGRKERAGGRDVLGGFDAEAGRMALSARGGTVAATARPGKKKGARGWGGRHHGVPRLLVLVGRRSGDGGEQPGGNDGAVAVESEAGGIERGLGFIVEAMSVWEAWVSWLVLGW